VYRDGTREGQVLTSGLPGSGAAECPQCSGRLVRSGGCETCQSCGFATCETTE